MFWCICILVSFDDLYEAQVRFGKVGDVLIRSIGILEDTCSNVY